MGGTENRAAIEKLLAGIDAGDISVMDDVFEPPEWRAAWVRVERPSG